MSDEDLDRAILSVAVEQWRKVARILLEVRDLTGGDTDADFERTGERIIALAAAGKLESQGNLARWRHSEVRLPQT